MSVTTDINLLVLVAANSTITKYTFDDAIIGSSKGKIDATYYYLQEAIFVYKITITKPK